MHPSVALVLSLGLSLGSFACQGAPRLAAQSCPAALAGGVLVQRGDDLILEAAPGPPVHVTWPAGVRVERVGEGLALMGFFGQVIARPGDTIEVGGGSGSDDTFHACGDIRVIAAES